MEFITNSAKETESLANKLGLLLSGGEVLLLEGDLGAGKTQFVKGLAKGLQISEGITSPTFTIERIYKSGKLELHHFDFYRLIHEDAEIVEEINELINEGGNVIAIEWPSNLKGVRPEEFFLIKIEGLDENKRKIIIEAKGEKYLRLLEKLG